MREASPVKRKTTKSAAPKNRIETPMAQTVYSPEEFNQKVQETAYQLFLARGCAHGNDVEDWFAAEQIVKSL